MLDPFSRTATIRLLMAALAVGAILVCFHFVEPYLPSYVKDVMYPVVWFIFQLLSGPVVILLITGAVLRFAARRA